MRRRVPWWVLVLLFVVLPVLEIYVLIQVGQVIGAVVDRAAAARRRLPGRLADEARGHPGLAARCARRWRAAACRPASWRTLR